MITNFETITHELTAEELNLVPVIVHSFRFYKKDNPIKADLIVKRMNDYLQKHESNVKMTQPRLRKIVNYIRTNGIIPLIATSNGYFTSDCKETIEEQIKSLQERANSIQRCAEGLKKFI
jgi:hypothetical protein